MSPIRKRAFLAHLRRDVPYARCVDVLVLYHIVENDRLEHGRFTGVQRSDSPRARPDRQRWMPVPRNFAFGQCHYPGAKRAMGTSRAPCHSAGSEKPAPASLTMIDPGPAARDRNLEQTAPAPFAIDGRRGKEHIFVITYIHPTSSRLPGQRYRKAPYLDRLALGGPPWSDTIESLAAH